MSQMINVVYQNENQLSNYCLTTVYISSASTNLWRYHQRANYSSGFNTVATAVNRFTYQAYMCHAEHYITK